MKCNTACLDDWKVTKRNTLIGEIYNDSLGRADGTIIETTQLLPMSMQVCSPREGVSAATQDCIYFLGKKK